MITTIHAVKLASGRWEAWVASPFHGRIAAEHAYRAIACTQCREFAERLGEEFSPNLTVMGDQDDRRVDEQFGTD